MGLESHFGIPDNHLLAVPVNLAGMCLDSGQERVVCTKKTLVIHVTEQSTYLSECSRTMEPVTDLLRSNEKKKHAEDTYSIHSNLLPSRVTRTKQK